jgi:hypothetical protein
MDSYALEAEASLPFVSESAYLHQMAKRLVYAFYCSNLFAYIRCLSSAEQSCSLHLEAASASLECEHLDHFFHIQ